MRPLEWLDRLSRSSQEESYHKTRVLARELLKIRVIVASIGLVVFFILEVFGVVSLTFWPIMVIASIEIAVNPLYAVLLRDEHNVEINCFLQLLMDAFLATVALSFTGGSQSTVAIVYFMVIIATAIILAPKFGYTAAGVCGAVYLMLVFLEQMGIVTPFAGEPGAGVGPFYYFTVVSWLFSFIMAAVLGEKLHQVMERKEGEIIMAKEEVEELSRNLEKLVDQRTAQLSLAHKDLQEQNRELVRLNEVKSNFLATVSHELRTPLTTVSGYIEMMTEGMLGRVSGEQKDGLKVMGKKSQQLKSLIDSLLDLSKLEEGIGLDELVAVDIRSLVEDIIQSYDEATPGMRGWLKNEIESRLPPAKVDRDRIRRVFENLLSNAIKFSGAKSAVTITGGRKDRRELWFSVADTGIGIPARALSRVSERFFQVDNSSTRKYEGTGLGLSIVKEIIDRHGGEIKIESEEGKGTTVTFSLPLAPPRAVKSAKKPRKPGK